MVDQNMTSKHGSKPSRSSHPLETIRLMSGGKNIHNCKISCNLTELGGDISWWEALELGKWKTQRFQWFFVVLKLSIISRWCHSCYHIISIFRFKAVECSKGLVLKPSYFFRLYSRSVVFGRQDVITMEPKSMYTMSALLIQDWSKL